MLLNDYLEQNDLSFSETARALGVAHATVVRLEALVVRFIPAARGTRGD